MTAQADEVGERAAEISPSDPGLVKRWVLGARPRTLPAAAVPVLVGTATGWWRWSSIFFRNPGGTIVHSGAVEVPATVPKIFGVHWWFWIHPVIGPGAVIWWRAFAALVVALGVQIGTNFANDYSDGVRGTDTRRVGPLRLVGSGLVAPSRVKRAAFISYGVAGLAGLYLAAVTTWWLLAIGAFCIAAGWLYTGGPKPYGYLGLGELFVFVFFGLVATVGSFYVQYPHLWVHGLSREVFLRFDLLAPLWAAIAVGLLATALLEANNLRDIVGDTASGKRTLAVQLGRRRAGWLYVGSLLGVVVGILLVAAVRPWALLALLATPLAIAPVRTVLSPAEGRELLPVLGATGRLQLAVGVLLAVGILL